MTADVPLLLVPVGTISLIDDHEDIELTGGVVWNKHPQDGAMLYEIGVAGSDHLVIDAASAGDAEQPESNKAQPVQEMRKRLYGIGITASQQLTVINSDGTCTHFAEYQLPPFHPETFEMDLPEGTRIISVSVDGFEVEEPKVESGHCWISLENGKKVGATHQVSLRLANEAVRLGFIGFTELKLPQTSATIGILNWDIVLPAEFHTQVESSGLGDVSDKGDLSKFGDYGQVLESRARMSLGRRLVPPGSVAARVKYYQHVAEITDDLVGRSSE